MNSPPSHAYPTATTPVDCGFAQLEHRPSMMAARSCLAEGHTDDPVSCGVPTLPYQPPPQDSEYRVRDKFTPAPSPSVSCAETPLPFSLNPFMLPPTSASSSSSASASAGPFTIETSRRDIIRRHAERAYLDDGLAFVRGPITHPYERYYRQKQSLGKRRKMWNHALEKLIFSPEEITSMGTPHRRTIYTASLEAHIDRLHDQLLGYSLAPVPDEALAPYSGLNAKTAKSMVSGLHHDACDIELKIVEVNRATKRMQDKLSKPSKL